MIDLYWWRRFIMLFRYLFEESEVFLKQRLDDFLPSRSSCA